MLESRTKFVRVDPGMFDGMSLAWKTTYSNVVPGSPVLTKESIEHAIRVMRDFSKAKYLESRMAKFNVGDKVRRTRDNHFGMHVGDEAIVTSVKEDGHMTLDKYSANHDMANFELVERAKPQPRFTIGQVVKIVGTTTGDSYGKLGMFGVITAIKFGNWKPGQNDDIIEKLGNYYCTLDGAVDCWEGDLLLATSEDIRDRTLITSDNKTQKMQTATRNGVTVEHKKKYIIKHVDYPGQEIEVMAWITGSSYPAYFLSEIIGGCPKGKEEARKEGVYYSHSWGWDREITIVREVEPSGISKLMHNITEFAKNLVLSTDEKLLRKHGLKDSAGNFTQTARDLVFNKLVADNEKYLIEMAEKFEAELKAEAKK